MWDSVAWAQGTSGSTGAGGGGALLQLGLIPLVTNLGKVTVTLQISDNTKIKIQKDHIARLRGEEED